eukprot:UN01049
MDSWECVDEMLRGNFVWNLNKGRRSNQEVPGEDPINGEDIPIGMYVLNDSVAPCDDPENLNFGVKCEGSGDLNDLDNCWDSSVDFSGYRGGFPYEAISILDRDDSNEVADMYEIRCVCPPGEELSQFTHECEPVDCISPKACPDDDYVCVYDEKQCVTNPCGQFRCEKFFGT